MASRTAGASVRGVTRLPGVVGRADGVADGEHDVAWLMKAVALAMAVDSSASPARCPGLMTARWSASGWRP